MVHGSSDGWWLHFCSLSRYLVQFAFVPPTPSFSSPSSPFSCTGRPLILSRSPKAIHTSSELVDAIRTATPDNSRFAIADNAIKSELPPNQEALLGLNSVNSYDSLSSRQYQRLTSRWSTKPNQTLGRLVKYVNAESALEDPAFPLSNVAVILSRRPLQREDIGVDW